MATKKKLAQPPNNNRTVVFLFVGDASKLGDELAKALRDGNVADAINKLAATAAVTGKTPLG